MYWHYGPMWSNGFFGWMGWLGPIIRLSVFFFVVFIIYKLFKNLINGIHEKENVIHYSSKSESLKILNERLARGEISEEEYQKIKNLILKN
ncbi:membrane protein [Thermosipho melanesiensis]|uniref:SHOCT domain-containing protein n=2 Tax=Thermosipho melanesiensis TaxID=46541 RepID=A6LLG2_THEM4|nr:SHOCT domain-containing protein [Thermosipho melanesiensis]ABR30763.1 hypothetical protein Tmel_0902 [Thermosipho melanesiensis BI429]APT73886.1 membrane protein [Thermosipho melanesiensis]OOC35827.1 membrane protein [Thermosipho melanesiensis]OOC38329.1 membrane protein [Thermosipho melanesiensis]OOC38790.1 membrane protein [Thermosipho melanesiensis]